jgi:hypothetical protein
MFQP